MIDPELKSLLDANQALLKENNIILRKMERERRNARIFRVLYWIAAAAVTIATFYYLQPFVKKIMDLFSSLGDLSNFLPK